MDSRATEPGEESDVSQEKEPTSDKSYSHDFETASEQSLNHPGVIRRAAVKAGAQKALFEKSE